MERGAITEVIGGQRCTAGRYALVRRLGTPEAGCFGLEGTRVGPGDRLVPAVLLDDQTRRLRPPPQTLGVNPLTQRDG